MESFWDLINIPMGYVMRLFNKLVGNQYVLALFLFAIFIEIILLPLAIKQQKNSIKQAKLRPKEMAIRKKYAGRDDTVTKQKISQEIQELYNKEGYSPFSGCLPMLIQLPVLFALYYIVLNPLRYICQLSTDAIDGVIGVVKSFPQYAEAAFTSDRTIDLMDAVKSIIETHGVEAFGAVEGFADKISGVSDIPNTLLFGINLSGTPSLTTPSLLLLVPVLTFLSYFFSMKMNRKLTYQPTTADDPATGCSNKMMDFMMPLMSVYISFIVPAAVGVYWIFKSLLGVLKQFIIHKAMPTPKFTEEDYKAAEKEYGAAKTSQKAPKNKSGKVVRSLHHIDDEDFEDTAEAGRARREALEAQEAERKANSGKKLSVLGSAPIKDDKKEDKAESTEKTETEDNENK